MKKQLSKYVSGLMGEANILFGVFNFKDTEYIVKEVRKFVRSNKTGVFIKSTEVKFNTSDFVKVKLTTTNSVVFTSVIELMTDNKTIKLLLQDAVATIDETFNKTITAKRILSENGELKTLLFYK
jgi:hypothetical protein